MTSTVNGITVYETKVRGTATSYIRESVVTPNPNDVTSFDAWETAGASASGSQTVSYGGTVTGGDSTGLANDSTAYTASIIIDGTTYAVSVVGSAAQTFTDLITEINADLPNTEAAISSGDIVVTSTGTGKTSYVTITDTDLFSSTTGFLKILDEVPGGTEGQLRSNSLDNGVNAWDAYKGSVEVYDTAADTVVVSTDAVALTDSTGGTANDTAVDVSTAVTGVDGTGSNAASKADVDTRLGSINDNFADIAAKINALTTKVNSLQDLVEALLKRA